jgi:hypothetical protein
MKKSIVITSIFEPTEAIKQFTKFDKYDLIVVGDVKTPVGWKCDGVNYISLFDQIRMDFELVKVLPQNHYCRKMIGYLCAIKNGSDIIIDTDDDNFPKSSWAFPNFTGDYDFVGEDLGFINIYNYYSDLNIWPRGLPLKFIKDRGKYDFDNIKNKNCNVGIWQGLADKDPDVDAIYRLVDGKECVFNDNDPIVLGKNTISPFNSQNTAFIKELFPLLYMPAHVTMRFTDILRGLVAQPIMWLYNYNLGILNATVYQERNVHNYFKDFLDEIPMYKHSEEVINIVVGAVNSKDNIYDNLFNAYVSLNKFDIVPSSELHILNAWLDDIEGLK